MAKKDFSNIENPAIEIIAARTAQEQGAEEPAYIELKNKRMSLLIKPSTYERLKDLQLQERIKGREMSVNSFIEAAIEEKLARECK